MNLNLILKHASESGIVFSAGDGNLKLSGPEAALQEVAAMAKPYKQELLKIVNGQTVDDVGNCNTCGGELLGLIVAGGYVNRVCGVCGEWAICLPPDWTLDDLTEHITERSAIMEHDGRMPRDNADREAVEAVRAEFAEQKSIFESADRIKDSTKENEHESSCAGKRGSVQSEKVVASPARLTTVATN